MFYFQFRVIRNSLRRHRHRYLNAVLHLMTATNKNTRILRNTHLTVGIAHCLVESVILEKKRKFGFIFPCFFAFQINKQKNKRIRSPTAIRSDGIYLPLTELSNLKFDFNFTT